MKHVYAAPIGFVLAVPESQMSETVALKSDYFLFSSWLNCKFCLKGNLRSSQINSHSFFFFCETLISEFYSDVAGTMKCHTQKLLFLEMCKVGF